MPSDKETVAVEIGVTGIPPMHYIKTRSSSLLFTSGDHVWIGKTYTDHHPAEAQRESFQWHSGLEPHVQC